MLLKTPIYYNSVLPSLGSTIKYVSDNMTTLSGGTLKMKIYEPNKLVNPKEILDAVSTGKVQAGYATAANWGGKIPAARLFSAVPFGPEAPEYLSWYYHGNGSKLHQELYDNNNLNVKVQVCGVLAPETSGWFKDEINKPEDLKAEFEVNDRINNDFGEQKNIGQWEKGFFVTKGGFIGNKY